MIVPWPVVRHIPVSLRRIEEEEAVLIEAPVLTGSPTLVASWDPNDPSTVTESSGRVTALSGADGTAFTLAEVSSSGPTAEVRNDLTALRFTSASSQYLQVASALGLSTACTIVVVCEYASVQSNQIWVDIANGASTATRDRYSVLSSNTIYIMRKCSATQQSDTAGGATPATGSMKLLIGAAPAGNTGARLYLDGSATSTTVGSAVNQPSGLSHATLGARRVSGANAVFVNGWVWRVLIYGVQLDATQLEEVAVWAAANYGTTNNA